MDTSEAMKNSFANVLLVYRELANLYTDADDLMEKNGWRSMRGPVEFEQSRQLVYSNYWLAQYTVKSYISENDASHCKVIGCFFVNDQYKPIDPILVLASMHGELDESAGEFQPFGKLKAAWWGGKPKSEVGEVYKIEASDQIQTGEMKSVLLADVTDYEKLETLVIDQLLQLK